MCIELHGHVPSRRVEAPASRAIPVAPTNAADRRVLDTVVGIQEGIGGRVRDQNGQNVLASQAQSEVLVSPVALLSEWEAAYGKYVELGKEVGVDVQALCSKEAFMSGGMSAKMVRHLVMQEAVKKFGTISNHMNALSLPSDPKSGLEID